MTSEKISFVEKLGKVLISFLILTGYFNQFNKYLLKAYCSSVTSQDPGDILVNWSVPELTQRYRMHCVVAFMPYELICTIESEVSQITTYPY